MGAKFEYGTCRFVVWAPNRRQVTLVLPNENQYFELDPVGNGYWTHTAEGLEPNTKYLYRLDGVTLKPDPASHFQPDGVFGPSAIIDHDAFKWTDNDWRGTDLADLVFYELHVGTFTPQGTLKAVTPRIAELVDFGINAIELLPLSQFSGKHNWGYDGVFPFAVQNTYGDPNDLKALVDECHSRGVSLFLDVVYNHLGPEGNCLNDYGPYFPLTNLGLWGPHVNLDGPDNEGVRNYLIENALYWFSHYHIDGIRLDSILSMPDNSPTPFLAELNQAVHRYREVTKKKLYLIAETGFNIPHVLASPAQGGFGFDGQWLDDFQHALFALITGDREGYYKDYGNLQDVAAALMDAYVYVGVGDQFRRKSPHEAYPDAVADRFVAFVQNHDQVGNRLNGDRLTCIVGFEAAKLAGGIVLLSPYVPLLFMGEEYGETAPFMFFTDYQNQDLITNIREGRRKEFARFHWTGDAPDPQDPATFENSKLDWQQRYVGRGQQIAAYYHALLKLRTHALFHPQPNRQIAALLIEQDKILLMHKQNAEADAVVVANFSAHPTNYRFPFEGKYQKILDSADAAYAGQGTTLPSAVTKGQPTTLAGYNLAVYQTPHLEAK